MRRIPERPEPLPKLRSEFDLVLSYPQWQGSGRDEHLLRGALATADALRPFGPVERIGLSDQDEDRHGIVRFAPIAAQLDEAQNVLARRRPGRILTAGGDCAVDIAIIDYLVGEFTNLTVIWIDTHLDANTPETSPSGNLHGMPVAAIMGSAAPGLQDRLAHPLAPERFRYAWAHVADEGDRAFQTACGLQWLGEDESIAGPIHIHFDLDVLNPEEFPYLAYPDEGGMPVETAVALLRRLSSMGDVVGLTFTEFWPASDAEAAAGAATIRRLADAVALREVAA